MNFQTLNKKQEQALQLYLSATPVTHIADKVGVARTTISTWIEKFNWIKVSEKTPVYQQILARIEVLLPIKNKTQNQLNELKILLTASSDKLAFRLDKKKSSSGQVAVNQSKKGKGKLKSVKNCFDGITQKDFNDKFNKILLPYQKLWRQAQLDFINAKNNIPRTRAILKSRQIGATWYFAAEAFENAVLTGGNQIFLSASKNQSDVFRTYIKKFAKDWFGVELKGTDQIELSNGATLYFLATSSRTAQSYHGHIYIDEFFWIPHFSELNKVATAMASHKKWRKTYFSTPSAMSHSAYPFWIGERMKNKQDKAEIITTHKELLNGSVGSDRIWRQMTTIKDAQNQGCNFFDITELKDEYSVPDFQNLFMCKFVDDSDSIFPLSKLSKCIVDVSLWVDFDITNPRQVKSGFASSIKATTPDNTGAADDVPLKVEV